MTQEQQAQILTENTEYQLNLIESDLQWVAKQMLGNPGERGIIIRLERNG